MDHAFIGKLIDYIEDVIFQTDHQLTLLFLNAAWKKHTGYEIENSLGKSLLSFLHSPFKQPDEVASSILNRKSQLVLLRHADDKVALYKITMQQEESSDLLSGVISRQTEIQLRESEEKYRLLAEHALDIIVLFSTDGKFHYISPSITRVLGYTPEEYMAFNVYDNAHPGDLSLLKEGLEELKHAVDEDVKVFQIKNKKGEYVWIESRSRLVECDPVADVGMILSVSRDISERKKAEIALKDSEQKQREAQRIAKMGSFEYDLVNDKVTWSDELHIIIGVDTSFEIDKNFLMSLIHPEDKKSIIRSFYVNIKKNKDAQADFRIIRPDGKILWVSGTNKLVKNEEGKPVKAVGIIQDITDRKKAEEKIEVQNRKLRKLNHELDNLIYSSSHDLRAPLSSALGLLSIIQLEKDPQKKEEYLKLMEKSLQRLDDFTRDILDLFRNARSAPEIEKVDLEKIARETLDECQFLEGSDQIDKIINIEQLAPFYSEGKRLKIIFSNLISNAIRYHNLNQPQPWIEISGIANEHHAIVYVKDNGQGIDTMHLDKVFNMFYRAHYQKKGSGLGLYLVKEIIEKLNGTISVSSVYGEGTTFTLELPNLKKIYLKQHSVISSS